MDNDDRSTTGGSAGPGTAPPPPQPPPPPHDSAHNPAHGLAGGPYGGPRVGGAAMRDVSRLRRSRADRTLAGVATGLARHLDIDPTVVKVGFVVLALFGGAGILLYVAMWLLVPEEGDERAVIHTGSDLQRILLIGAAAVAALLVLGQGWGGWGFGPALPVALLLIVVVALLVGRDNRRQDQLRQQGVSPAAGATADPWATAATAPPAPLTDETAPLYGAPTAAGAGTPPPPPPPPGRPAWAPPPYRPPVWKAPRRSGVVWFWPTLALIAVGLGALGVYDAGHDVAQAAYPALALAITGVMLVVGAFRGRPGGLTLIGLVAAFAMAITSLVGLHEGTSETADPRTAAEIRSDYRFENGELVLNLSNLDDVRALDGRDISVRGGAGVIEVVVPRGVSVNVDSEIRFAGGYEIGERQNGGFDTRYDTTLAGPAGAPELDLDLSLRVGQITVRYPYE